MASEYGSAVVQLQDGRELYLKNVEWGAALKGIDHKTRRSVTIKASNIATLIEDVSEQEYEQHAQGDSDLLTTRRWGE